MRLTALLVLIIVIWCCSAKPNRRRGPGGRNRDPAAPEQRNGRGNKRPGGRGRGRVTPPPGDSIEEIEGDIDMEDDEMFPDPTDVDNGDENTDNGLNDQDCPEPDQLDEAEGSCTFDMTHNMENLDFLASVVFSENVFIFEIENPFDFLVRRGQRRPQRRGGQGGRRQGGGRQGRGQRRNRKTRSAYLGIGDQKDNIEQTEENEMRRGGRRRRRGPRPQRLFRVTNIEQLESKQYVMRFMYTYDNSSVPTYFCASGCSMPLPPIITPPPSTAAPTEAPSPSTAAPTEAPSPSTAAPTVAPSPSTAAPTAAPTTDAPTAAPTTTAQPTTTTASSTAQPTTTTASSTAQPTTVAPTMPPPAFKSGNK